MTVLLIQLRALILAVVAAVIYAVGSYLKQNPPEKFSEEKLFVTIIIALVIGTVSFILGVTLDVATQLLASAGLIVYIEVWGKALYRRLKRWLEKRLNNGVVPWNGTTQNQ